MSGANDCPRCGADMVLPERVCIICLTAENARLRDRLAVVLDELHLPGDALPGAEIAGIGDLLRENARLRGELELWKAAEEMRGRQLAAVACERNAYSEEAEKIEASLAPHRRPGQDTLAVIAALTAENARLRGELVDAAALHLADEQSVRNMERRIASMNSELALLRLDLARVTGERDGLKMFADGVVEGDCHYGDACPTFGSRHGKCVVCQAREALAACAPPTSGESD